MAAKQYREFARSLFEKLRIICPELSEITYNNEVENLIKRIPINNINSWLKERGKKKYKQESLVKKDDLFEEYDEFSSGIKRKLLREHRLQRYTGRVPNFPEFISENLVLYALIRKGWTIETNCGQCNTKSCDIQWTDSEGETHWGEVKCKFSGPSQFSPKKKSPNEILFYVDAQNHLDGGKIIIHYMRDYEEKLKSIEVKKGETVCDQQGQGRRARFSIDTPEFFQHFIPLYEGSVSDLLK